MSIRSRLFQCVDKDYSAFVFEMIQKGLLLCRARAVTRGVNKVVKEDLKMSLERQVLRSRENVVELLRAFLVDEAELLQQHLAT